MSKFLIAVLRLLAAGILMAVAASATAQPAYPTKPIRIIVPFPSGGSTDAVARIVGQKLTESWGQQVLVENRGGGNTIIGSDAAAKSPPDGYTVLLTTNAHIINPNLFFNLPYDTIKDFAPVATITSGELALALHPSVPANNLQEFIALAKAKPGQFNYASSGIGNPNHLAAEMFNLMANVRMQHVPYKGGGPALADLIGGQVQVHFATPITALPHIKSGKLKAIAVSGANRISVLPEMPTFTEAGLPGLDIKFWQAVFAPAGTPKPIVDKLSKELARIVALPDVREKLSSQGLEPFYSTPEQFAKLIKADLTRFAKLIKAANIKIDK